MIKGPPGTGKSFVISAIANLWIQKENYSYAEGKILVCAPSNTAADSIAEKMNEFPGLRGKFVRVTSL